MKRTIVLSMAFIASMFLNFSLAADPGDKTSKISTLVINAKVTVMLVGNDQATMEVIGDRNLEKAITFSRSGDSLIVGAVRNRDYTGDGIVYVSANQLRKIYVNSDAHVKSLNTLQIPVLDVVINGVCEFDIHNIGELNLVGTKDYVVEQKKESRRFPASVLESVKN